MPFQIGSVAVHDDGQHFGSAKRDVASGVAGLDSSGDLLVPGLDIHLNELTSGHMYIKNQGTGESMLHINRSGANDFLFQMKAAGAWSNVQYAALKDVANGIAALDASGFILAAGAGIKFPRNGSDDVHIYEKTSGEEAYAFHRAAANDYTFYIKESNIWRRFQTETMKDVASGIAGLDANALLSSALLPPCLEEYANHLGAVDNFTQTVLTGNGAATSDATNHEMDLTSGAAVAGYAIFETKKRWLPSTKPLVGNFLIQNIVNGAGNYRLTQVGFTATHTDYELEAMALFMQLSDNSWVTRVSSGGGGTETAITALANGDLCTVVVYASVVYFFVNGVLVRTDTANLPAELMKCGVSVHETWGDSTVARQISVDMMTLKSYV